MIGTPASPPKTRGKSPGLQVGQPRLRRIRYPIVKQGTVKLKLQKIALILRLFSFLARGFFTQLKLGHFVV